MLKIYDSKNMYKLNDNDWKYCGDSGYCCVDDTEVRNEEIIFQNYTFEQVQEYLKTNYISGIYNAKTMFRKKPVICINSDFSLTNPLTKDKVNSLSYKIIREENHYITLDWIIKHLTAEEAITYLKQRDMKIFPYQKGEW